MENHVNVAEIHKERSMGKGQGTKGTKDQWTKVQFKVLPK